jgi:hypothetical protein
MWTKIAIISRHHTAAQNDVARDNRTHGRVLLLGGPAIHETVGDQIQTNTR